MRRAHGDAPPLAKRGGLDHARAMTMRSIVALLGVAILIATAFSAGDAAGAGVLTRPEAFARAAALTALGRSLFFDPSLSASGKLSCASCHDPAHAFGPPNDLSVERGGARLTHFGLRAVPSLRYLQATPQFAEHYYESEDEGDASVDNGPTGGLTWDGRVDRGRDQARLPLLSPDEMANKDPAAIVAAVRRAPYAGELRALAGAEDDPAKAWNAILDALEAYEEDYRAFYPYSSKYDAYLAGKAALTPAEARGLALFDDPAKGNCAQCHPSARGNDGTPPQFTDYGFAALGVPRNPAIPANANPRFYDLGLCGPLRRDLRRHPDYCGMFKTPSLRNVATRHVFFHNGVSHSLEQAVEFYAMRDTDPARWYPRDASGKVRKFDDLPVRYRGNIDRDPPLDRHEGEKPALDAAEIRAIIAFLGTLSDGYGAPK
jgi:cytochrome c peroxidase